MAKVHSTPTQTRLKEVLSYDPETGVFTWRIWQGGGSPRAGTVAGNVIDNNGILRRVVKVDQRTYYTSRLAWLYVHGEWPPDQVDHENRDALDDRITNLRLATKSQNQANTRKYKHSKSPYRGITKRKTGKWVAQISVNGTSHGLGTFDTPEEAARAYNKAAVERFGEFAQLNQIIGD